MKYTLTLIFLGIVLVLFINKAIGWIMPIALFFLVILAIYLYFSNNS